MSEIHPETRPDRRSEPEITITYEGSNTSINIDYGSTVYHSLFSTGDIKARESAIECLIQDILGFAKAHILIKLHQAEKPEPLASIKFEKANPDSNLEIGEPKIIGDYSEEPPKFS